MAILVGNLSSQVTEADLRNLFTKYDTVQKIFIFNTVGYATVEIEGEANEKRAVQELNGAEHFGQKLQLFKSTQDEEPATRDPTNNPPPSDRP